MKTDNKGFQKFEGGALVVTSTHSAFGARLTTGVHTVPVRGVPGVFALLTGGEYARLTEQPSLMDEIVVKAREAFPAPVKAASHKD